MDVSKKLCEIIKKSSSIVEVNPTNKFCDMGINSLDFIRIIVEIEEHFNIEFDEDFLNKEKFSTVFDMVCYINKQIEKKNSML